MSLTYGKQREVTDAELPEVRNKDLWYPPCMSEPRGSGQSSTSCRKRSASVSQHVHIIHGAFSTWSLLQPELMLTG